MSNPHCHTRPGCAFTPGHEGICRDIQNRVIGRDPVWIEKTRQACLKLGSESGSSTIRALIAAAAEIDPDLTAGALAAVGVRGHKLAMIEKVLINHTIIDAEAAKAVYARHKEKK